MIYYASVGDWIAAAQNNCAKVAAIQAIIDTYVNELLPAALDVSTATVQEIMLNDGQTIVKTMYRSPKEIIDYLMMLERLKQYYLGQLRGRTVQMKSAPNFLYGRLGWTF